MFYNQSNRQAGFTMIELMISLVLGLLITAAAIQIYVINVKTSTIQKSGSELQDASVFGLQTIESHIRLANLGNPTTSINDTLLDGGIVFTGFNIGNVKIEGGVKKDNYLAKLGFLTRSEGDTKGSGSAWTGISNTDVDSDQLTIQYRNTTGTVLSDCEGNDVANGERVIERYFLRLSKDTQPTGAFKKLVLACDAGRINPTDVDKGIYEIQTFGGTDQRNFEQAGQELIAGVDQFKVLLGVQGKEDGTASTEVAKDGMANYVSSNVYQKMSTKPAITSVKIGMLVSGNTVVLGDEVKDNFNILGTKNTLKSGYTQQIRNTYETTVILRNARVIRRSTS